MPSLKKKKIDVPKDYYKILGVAENASAEEIKKTFRVLAHQYHPDKAGGDEAMFKKINEAYQVLGDAEKRKKYDQFGSAAFSAGGGPASGWEGFQGSPGEAWSAFGRDFGQGGIKFDFGDIGDLGDMFGSAFGFGGRPRRASSGRDLQVDLTLSFEESVFGASKDITFNKTDACVRCGGVGAEPGSKMKTCGECNGSGYQVRLQRTILGSFQSKTMCSSCDGAGEIPERKCSECRGSGLQKIKKTLTVDIPAGVEDSNTLRLHGQGETVKGGRSGDLFVRLRVKEDVRFVRDGFDLRSEATICFVTAALGGMVEVATVDGRADLKIPAGTQSHTEFRLRGKGVPGRYGRGDHIVLVKVAKPRNLSKKQRQLLAELGL